jgi:hypothetical protein
MHGRDVTQYRLSRTRLWTTGQYRTTISSWSIRLLAFVPPALLADASYIPTFKVLIGDVRRVVRVGCRRDSRCRGVSNHQLALAAVAVALSPLLLSTSSEPV